MMWAPARSSDFSRSRTRVIPLSEQTESPRRAQMLLVSRADLQFCVDAIAKQHEHKARAKLEKMQQAPSRKPYRLLFSFGQCLRHAFFVGAGYGDYTKISEADQKRFTAFEPVRHKGGSFDRVLNALGVTPEMFTWQGVDKNPENPEELPDLPKDAVLTGFGKEPLCFLYRNYRGEVSQRRVRVLGISYRKTPEHPTEQWFIEAHCLDRDAPRTFAINDIIGVNWQASAVATGLVE